MMTASNLRLTVRDEPPSSSPRRAARRRRGRSRRRRSLRQFRPGLLRHHVRGVPVRPVRVPLSDALLVLPVGGLRTPERARQIACRREGRRRRIDATRQSRRELLEQPAVAIRIMERSERAVAAMLGIRTADPEAPKQVRLVRARVHPAGVMEYLADLDAAIEHPEPGGVNWITRKSLPSS